MPINTNNKIPQQISVNFVDDAFHFPWRHCHVQVCTDYTRKKPEFENEWLSKVMNRWVSFRLKVVSSITNNDYKLLTNIPELQQILMVWINNSFSTVCLLLKRCLVNCFSLAELFQRFWDKISQKISTRLDRHHMQRFSASDAAASTRSNFCTFRIGIVSALLKQWLTCIQIFGLLSSGINIKAANVEQEAASAVASVDTKT